MRLLQQWIIMFCCRGCCPLCVMYYRNVMTFVPGGFALLALVALLMLVPQNLGTRRKQGTLTPCTIVSLSCCRAVYLYLPMHVNDHPWRPLELSCSLWFACLLPVASYALFNQRIHSLAVFMSEFAKMPWPMTSCIYLFIHFPCF